MKYGVVELSGEAVTLVICEATADDGVRTIRRDTVVLGLARHLDEDNRLPAGLTDLVAETVRRMKMLAQRAGCQDVTTVIAPDLDGTDVQGALAAVSR